VSDISPALKIHPGPKQIGRHRPILGPDLQKIRPFCDGHRLGRMRVVPVEPASRVVGVGAAKGTGDVAKGAGKGALDLATFHPVNAGAAIGKGAACCGEDVAVGTAKGIFYRSISFRPNCRRAN